MPSSEEKFNNCFVKQLADRQTEIANANKTVIYYYLVSNI